MSILRRIGGSVARSMMPRGTPFSAEDRAFVRDAYPKLGPAQIARKLGRSRSGVYGLIEAMKQTGELPSEEGGDLSVQVSMQEGEYGHPFEADGEPQDTLGRLKWVRDLLERQLRDSEPTSAARLAKEYRDTVEAIGRMEAADGDGEDVVGDFAALIAQKLG